MKEFLPRPTSGQWPVELIAGPRTKEWLVYLLSSSEIAHKHALNDWTPHVDREVSAISARFHEAGVQLAVQQSKALEDQLRAAFGNVQTLNQFSEAVVRLEAKIDQLLKKLDEAAPRDQSIRVPVETLEPEPYELLRPFTAVITKSGEEFEASLFDASIFASGDTEEDALADLKDTLIDTYERLNELADNQLGPGPLRQKKILNKLIRKVEYR
jgi:outer membrane murein-binding lipoprotein Lpp